MKPIAPLRPPRVDLVVLLHGVGSCGADLAPIADGWRRRLGGVRFATPDAPFPFDGSAVGRQWFSIAGIDLARRAERVDGAAPAFDALIERTMTAAGTTIEHTVLVGFSQGTIMALDALGRGQPVAGVLGFSGRLAREPVGALAATPVLLVHGDRDPVIPFEDSVEARRVLAAHGAMAEVARIAGEGHGIGPGAAAVGLGFLQRLVAGEPS